MTVRKYKFSDRLLLMQFKKAEKLGFSEPTISREINRNSIGGEYWADQAHRLYSFADRSFYVSHETIYKWMYELKAKGITLYMFLCLPN